MTSSIVVQVGDFAERVKKAEAEARQREEDAYAAARPYGRPYVDEMQELHDAFSKALNTWAEGLGTSVEKFKLVLHPEYGYVWYSAEFICEGIGFEAYSGRLGRGVREPIIVKMWGSDIQIRTMEDIGKAMLQRKRFKPPGNQSR